MNNQNNKKAWYKKWWVWVIIIFVLIGIGGAAGSSSNSSPTNIQPTNNGTQQTQTPAPAVKKKWDVETEYAKVTNGMTKPEVEAALGKTSDNCTESSNEYIGKTEYCSYGSFGDNGSISVTYSNDKVSSKSKMKF
jgi:hypothetical protein